jgi:hypothetical protein
MLRKRFLRSVQKPPRRVIALIILIYIAFIFWPFYTVRYVFQMPLDTEVDPKVVNGLLTASSIIFGFMLVLIPWQEKWFGGWLWSFFVIPFLMLIFAGTELFLWGLERAYPIDAFSFVMASFQANVVSAAILFALRETIRKISQ